MLCFVGITALSFLQCFEIFGFIVTVVESGPQNFLPHLEVEEEDRGSSSKFTLNMAVKTE